MQIILASQSPRRRQLLEQMGVRDFTVRPAVGEEKADPGLSPAELVEALSRQKAAEVAAGAGEDDLIVAADTVVAIDGLVLGKPRDRAEAAEMLARLSGRVHQVFSGLTVRRGDRTVTLHECTQVRFRKLSRREIEAQTGADTLGYISLEGLRQAGIDQIIAGKQRQLDNWLDARRAG